MVNSVGKILSFYSHFGEIMPTILFNLKRKKSYHYDMILMH